MSAVRDSAPAVPAPPSAPALTLVPPFREAADPATPSSASDLHVDTREVWESVADAVGRQAVERTLAVRAVASAQFAVGGSPEAPDLDARVHIRADAEFAGAVDRIMESVVPDMERTLGRRFVENRIEFAVAGTGGGASILSIV